MTISDSSPSPNVQNDIRVLAQLISDLTDNVNQQLRDFHQRIIALEERLAELEEEKEE